ncbi:MAG: ADP-ribose pyrophosphatase [candidate division WS6 bacterium OLB20]|uniref:ADP-ribose pyrophosphatase n=1 Tax=candidate division WS6 bacterium OLB20 TaxID=1617426 RepID=A0A136LYX4_9BACT|nr:MAG: ADP-ribose pyrophosphatase [candidate division WS6 bacterium OLB20]
MWKILSTKELFKHPRITLLEDEVELPSGERTHYLKFFNKADGADAVAVNSDGKILLVKEYNHPVGVEMWQFPGGFIDAGETPEQAARRELIEEGGYEAATLRRLGGHHIYRRRIAEISHVFLATELKPVQTSHEQSESGMTAHWFSENEIDTMIKEEEITASDTLAIWTIYKANR